MRRGICSSVRREPEGRQPLSGLTSQTSPGREGTVSRSCARETLLDIDTTQCRPPRWPRRGEAPQHHIATRCWLNVIVTEPRSKQRQREHQSILQTLEAALWHGIFASAGDIASSGGAVLWLDSGA
mmetsp:Transcript_23481/g.61742  ORF Transcript_23481/g.61742 Transcript_23481/m.61742 type:complete len:126 (-) Transcript_23481:2081-2458(-)